jgi:hypothetical protein
MTFDKWQESIRPKMEGTRNLHNLLPKDLDFFIALSSISNILGNAGQTNYCAGNAFQEAFCHYRVSLGLKATCISVGVMSDTEEYLSSEFWGGFLKKHLHLVPLQIKEKDFLCALMACMRGYTSDGVSVPTSLITGLRDNLERGHDGASLTGLWATDRKLELRQKPTCEKPSRSSSDNGANKVSTAAQLKAATTIAEASAAVEWALRCNIASSMTAQPEDVDPKKPLHSYSVDSLKAVEVRNWVFREIKTEVSVFDILSQMSIAKLSVKIAANSKLVSEEIARQGREMGGTE